jgi:2',3'-cyclic-nucleotide 2'-phosphodiesterase (5'-nucleotidase family)
MGAGTSFSSALPEVVTEDDAKAIVGPRWPALQPHFTESLGGASAMSKTDFLAFVFDKALGHLNGGRGDAIDDATCMLRVIHISDVYDLGSMPSLKTLVDKWKLPEGYKTLVTCGGNFLAPSLLSGVDHGTGMVDCLNALPADYVSFGNHEGDVPHASLLQRIDEFNGKWLNSNSPEITAPRDAMPLYDIVELVSADAAQLRRVGFIGILCAYVYEAGAFAGKAHTIEDPQKASLRMAETLHSQEADAMIPITHLDQEDDEKLVEALSDQPLPVPAILGGHEHSPMVKHVNNTKVVKAGMDALQAVIVDVVWKSPEDALPQTRVWMEPVASYHPDQAMAKRVEKHLAALKVLAPQAPAGADGEGEVEENMAVYPAQ